MPVNDWKLNALYLPGGPGGFWTQPVPGGPVYPQQVQANSDILTTEPFSDLSGTDIGGCGHSFNSVTVYRDHDYETGLSVALITCPLCSFVLRRIEPFEKAIGGNNLVYAILTP